MVGAEILKRASIQLVAAPITGGTKQRKPTRSIVRSPRISFDDREENAVVTATFIREKSCPLVRSAEPTRICVIINPASGPGRSEIIYNTCVKPILTAGGCRTTIHVTQGKGHATDIARAIKPGQFTSIVAVGGDGTVFEILQGLLLQRPDWKDVASLPLVQVPSGSGNALAASSGLWNAVSAAHALMKGALKALDIMSVVQPNSHNRWVSFLSLTYGLIPCLDLGTENLRWLGGTRFAIGALHQILRKRSYPVEIGCVYHHEDDDGDDDEELGRSIRKKASEQGEEEEEELDGPPLYYCGTASTLLDTHQWHWLSDVQHVQLFALCNLPWLDMNFNLAPELAMDDGCLHLIYTPGGVSRSKGLQIMTAAEKGKHMRYVNQAKVVALVIKPLSPEGTTWLVADGEEIAYQTTYIEVHPQLCQTVVAPS